MGFNHVSNPISLPQTRKKTKRSDSGKMPKNSFYAPREKEANKQKTQALSSFFRKRRGYFPLIKNLPFGRSPGRHHTVFQRVGSSKNLTTRFDPGGETLVKSLSFFVLHVPCLKHRQSTQYLFDRAVLKTEWIQVSKVLRTQFIVSIQKIRAVAIIIVIIYYCYCCCYLGLGNPCLYKLSNLATCRLICYRGS